MRLGGEWFTIVPMTAPPMFANKVFMSTSPSSYSQPPPQPSSDACSFTGAGSYFDFDRSRTGFYISCKENPACVREHLAWKDQHEPADSELIGMRVCTTSGSTRRGLNYFVALGPGAPQLPDGHELRTSNYTTWLLFGDSTDREMVRSWCGTMRRLHPTTTRLWNATSAISRHRNNVGCTIGGRFSVANMFHFGMDTSSQPPHNQALMRNTSLFLDEPIESSDRLKHESARRSVITRAFNDNGRDPTFITLHSCMWDMNRTPLNNATYYLPAKLQNYGRGLRQLVATARSSFPSSRILLTTCKPINQLDENPLIKGQPWDYKKMTRTRRLQVALDSMMRHVAMTTGTPLIDANAVLGGFEYYASGRGVKGYIKGVHYSGKGANTLFNAMLNEMFGA